MEFVSGYYSSCVSLSLPFIFLLFHFGEAIRCYQCLDRPKSHERHLSCSYFDKSNTKFHADCEHSTFCLKRASTLQLNNGTVVSIAVYKCADQSQKTVFEDETGAFNWGKIIHRYIYNDGCFSHPTHFMLTTETTHCFCSTDLCNGGPHFTPQQSTSSTILITLLSTLVTTFILTS